jgi:hypothetical protein
VPRLASAAVLIATLLILTAQATNRGMADLHARNVREYFKKWEKARAVVPLAEWRAALEAAENAQRLNPKDPDALENLARLYDWATYRKPPTQPVVLAYKEQALVYFRSAALERPVSGYTWANLAQTKGALGQIDREYVRALGSAALLGPWEPEVQLSLADSGLAAWPKLSEDTRQIVRDTIGRGLRRYAKDVLRIAKDRGRTDIVCALGNRPVETATLACR